MVAEAYICHKTTRLAGACTNLDTIGIPRSECTAEGDPDDPSGTRRQPASMKSPREEREGSEGKEKRRKDAREERIVEPVQMEKKGRFAKEEEEKKRRRNHIIYPSVDSHI
ncbi:hypothetical protein EAG_12893 [Camponotus floridanus]|uniref:Uncharacterized protein n=1 Tax=Camponotus floridanus TaxID=104421 RepID=E2ATS1_CAMFO|nr:hypothetical protein EAG_12893 [Camponotus floridanus]